MSFKSIVEDHRFRFIADLAEIFSATFVIVKALSTFFQNRSFIDSWWKGIGLAVVAVLSIKLVSGILISKVKSYLKLYKKESAIKDIEMFGRQNSRFRPDESLPSTKQLRLWLEVAFSEAKEWADDSVLLGSSLTLNVSGGRLTSINSHFTFLSNWRKEIVKLLISSDGMSKFYKEHSGLDDYRRSYQINTKKFFEKYGGWKQAYAFTYQKLEDHIGTNSFSSHITFNIYKKEVVFIWQYLKGKVEFFEHFIFDGKSVKHSRDQMAKKIKWRRI